MTQARRRGKKRGKECRKEKEREDPEPVEAVGLCSLLDNGAVSVKLSNHDASLPFQKAKDLLHDRLACIFVPNFGDCGVHTVGREGER